MTGCSLMKILGILRWTVAMIDPWGAPLHWKGLGSRRGQGGRSNGDGADHRLELNRAFDSPYEESFPVPPSFGQGSRGRHGEVIRPYGSSSLAQMVPPVKFGREWWLLGGERRRTVEERGGDDEPNGIDRRIRPYGSSSSARERLPAEFGRWRRPLVRERSRTAMIWSKNCRKRRRFEEEDDGNKPGIRLE